MTSEQEPGSAERDDGAMDAREAHRFCLAALARTTLVRKDLLEGISLCAVRVCEVEWTSARGRRGSTRRGSVPPTRSNRDAPVVPASPPSPRQHRTRPTSPAERCAIAVAVSPPRAALHRECAPILPLPALVLARPSPCETSTSLSNARQARCASSEPAAGVRRLFDFCALRRAQSGLARRGGLASGQARARGGRTRLEEISHTLRRREGVRSENEAAGASSVEASRRRAHFPRHAATRTCSGGSAVG